VTQPLPDDPHPIAPPASGLQRRPHGSGDAWVDGPDGRRFWGVFGAAGLLVNDAERGILLQHRVEWSHFGGTWGLPGGARHEDESPEAGAVREAEEEAGVPAANVRLRFSSVLDLGWWSYSTVVADVTEPFDPVVGDAESLELRWVRPADVASLPLHPGFAASWPRIAADLDVRPVVIVDAANVVGSRPDGWWRDRAAAADRLINRVDGLTRRGWPADLLGLDQHSWWPEVLVVIEGQAKAASSEPASVTVLRAERDGDSAIVDEAARATADGSHVLVVTADRELSERVGALGARVGRPGGLLALLGD
jgi:8-oxo-dGTP pyrophosphatase MutT (NUDIX family)